MASDSDRVPSSPAQGTATVVVTGAAGALGRQVCALTAADPDVGHVIAIDRRSLRRLAAGIECHEVDLTTADLKPLFEGATEVIHLAQADGPRRGEPRDHSVGDGAIARRVFDAAASVGAEHVVLLSTATAYGAWANNPVPLTEDAPLRPNPGVAAASEMAEAERTAADFRDNHPGATIAILRPTVTVSAQGNGWLARALARTTALPVGDREPPAQFLDISDLATAVDVARRARLDGPRNVAPDGWVSGETVRALAGGIPRVRLPERFAIRVAGMRWKWGLAPTPPELLPYTVHPWVIANDRLKADGWAPASSNEEAYVGAHRAGPWATLSPRRRQEAALGAVGLFLVGAVAGVAVVVRRRRRR
ncbi:MAG: NAD-dependent epimerase/dehydratase family protein [Acidimicrobiales bacterium]